MFTDYLMENLRPLITDSDDLVRMTYVQCLAGLAECGIRFLATLNPLQSGLQPVSLHKEEMEDAPVEVGGAARYSISGANGMH